MTDEELNKAIAEALGCRPNWNEDSVDCDGKPIQLCTCSSMVHGLAGTPRLPDYADSVDACLRVIRETWPYARWRIVWDGTYSGNAAAGDVVELEIYGTIYKRGLGHTLAHALLEALTP